MCRKVKAIKSKYLAGWLMYSKGLDLVNYEPDKFNPKFNVYLFEDTDTLQGYIKEYKNAHSKSNNN